MNFNKIKQILRNKKVGIAGCGGLGSNCAIALARVGVGNLVIADFDKIEESNLNRQYFFYEQIGLLKAETLKHNILKVNPIINVECHNLVLTENNIPEIFKDCDIIVEAFDKVEMKEIIFKTVSIHFPNKYLVMGNGMAGWGSSNIIKEQNFDKLIVCGDNTTEISETLPPLAPRVGIVANMQANAVLNILLGNTNYGKVDL